MFWKYCRQVLLSSGVSLMVTSSVFLLTTILALLGLRLWRPCLLLPHLACLTAGTGFCFYYIIEAVLVGFQVVTGLITTTGCLFLPAPPPPDVLNYKIYLKETPCGLIMVYIKDSEKGSRVGSKPFLMLPLPRSGPTTDDLNSRVEFAGGTYSLESRTNAVSF